MKTGKLTWLHVSDLQVERNSDSTVRKQLLKDAASLLDNENLEPDLVFFTGDLAFSGKNPEFMWGRRFFEEMRDLSALTDTPLFLIPGNHDWERESQSTDGSADDKSAATRLEQNSSSDPETRSRGRALALSPNLDNYYRLVQDLRGPVIARRQLVYVEELTLNGISVAVVGLNTAWLGDPEPAISNIPWLSISGLVETALMRARDAQVRITLLHHPPDSLPGDLAMLVLTDSDFVLHSHAHSGDVIPTVTTSGTVVLNGGSDPGNPRHPNAYNIAEVDFGNRAVRIHMRRLRGSTWHADPQVPDGIVGIELPPRLLPLSLSAEEQIEEELAWRLPFAGYATDKPGGDDQLNIEPDVEAFSAVFASQKVDPPLCLGLFGDWGAGKTFFMDKMWERIELLRKGALAAGDGPCDYCKHIVQIRFNAWHYIDTNLWASLANHIFKELSNYISKSPEISEKEKSKLFRELETSKKLLDEAKARQEAAEQRRDGAKLRLLQARRDQEALLVDCRDVPQAIIREIFNQDEDMKRQWEQIADQIGFSDTLTTAQDLDQALKETRTFWGRFRASFRKPENRWRWALLLFLVLIVIPLVTVGLNRALRALNDSPQLISTAAFFVAQVTAVFAAAKLWLKPVLAVIARMGSLSGELRRRAQLRMEVDLSALQEEEAAARQVLAEAQQRFDRAKEAVQEIKGIRDERRLMQFIEERVASKEYERHLGLISVVHRDFESLSDMLGEGSNPDLPRIDRIILYIDDLDRCPEDKVVDVLQAVHLLLAFPLFIVVVGVDSRWLLRSLERSYPAVQPIEPQETGLSEEEWWAWEATPQNYLEKIFQIPFHLDRMDSTGVKKLVDDMLTVREQSSSEDEVPVSDSQEEAQDDDLPTEQEPEPTASVETEQVPNIWRRMVNRLHILLAWILGSQPDEEVDRPEEQEPTVEPAEPRPPEPPKKPDPELAEVDLSPPALEIKDWEKDFIPHLWEMLPTPRAAKRFVNIYRLIRTRIPSLKELEGFVGNEQNPGDFQVAMVLLAVLTGFPRQSPHVFRWIRDAGEDSLWWDSVDTLLPEALADTQPQRFQNVVVPRMEAAEAAEWTRLHTALSNLKSNTSLPTTLKPYIEWVPRVARFSFRAGKITGDVVEQ